jgi:hypothetical protein
MEVFVLLEDKTGLELSHGLSRSFRKTSGRMREGAVNSDAPACNSQFDTAIFRRDLPLYELPISPINFGFILPHDLLKRTHLRKK